jgi:hypothetical protein
MKKLLIIFLCLTGFSAFSQQQFFLKKFPANNSTRYITNSPTVRGIVFFYKTASDTSKAVMYIPNFKQSDIQSFGEKTTFYNAKLCFNNYKSSPGDFIYSFPSEGGIIYFYHPKPESKFD